MEGMRGSVARTYKWLGSCLLIGHPRRYEVYEIDCGTKVSKMSERPYTKDGRLADVLALIQVLALDKSTYRSEDGITAKELVKPSSAESVVVLATEHPEFFRVNPAREHCISLLARHVQPKDPVQDTRLPLTSEFTRMLMEVAVDLHDRQVAAAEWWKTWVPLVSALAAALIASTTTLFTLWLNGWCRN